jgi:hypothetical protein
MISIPRLGPTPAAKHGRRAPSIVTGALALATIVLVPPGAWSMDSSSKLTADTAGNLLPLPPIPYLDSMRWMNWKPSAPISQGRYSSDAG